MKKTKLALAMATAAFASTQAYATNGMNMDGYGPISEAMGGTAQAYNNGLGGMMNNPATMGMGAKEGNKVQIAIGNLRPDVAADMTGMPTADSSGDSYVMPGFGYATKKDGFTWGVGVLAQGGMGTDYAGDSFLAAGTGIPVRSEVGVGRLVFPVNMEVNDKLTIGGSIDYVWAGMDLKMAVAGSYLRSNSNGGLVSSATGGLNNFVFGAGGMDSGTVQPDGSVTGVFGGTVANGRFDFSDGSDYTGEAKGTGFGGKLGFTYKIDKKTSFGASYHTKTNLSDLTTSNAEMSMTFNGTPATMKGDISVKDFQWPSTIAFGVSTKANDKWTINADFKRINWQEVMKSMKMNFVVTDNTQVAGFGINNGDSISVAMPQNWEDQNVFMLGAEYKYSDKLKLRAGANLSSNPIPDATLNPLFPAIIENHYTAGFGYNYSENSGVDFSLSYSPEVVQTSGAGVTSSHSQMSWQAMYTYKWGVKK